MPDSAQTLTQADIEAHLAPLIGLKLSIARRAADMRIFHFGEIRSIEKGTVGEYALHMHASWRIENELEIVTGQRDIRRWKFGKSPLEWDYEKGGDLQDALLSKLLKGYDPATRSLIKATDQLVVERVEVTFYGDATLHLSGGYRLVLFPTSRFVESWRVFQPGSLESHFVVVKDNEDYGFAPNTAADYLERAKQRKRSDDYKGAIEDCTEAIRLDPLNSDAYDQRGNFFDMDMGDNELALADYTEAIRLDPLNWSAYHSRALLNYFDLKDYDAAIADYSKAIELELYQDSSYEGRGYVLGLKGDYDAAIADYTKAIEFEPIVDRYVWRGLLQSYKGDFVSALADCDAALQLEPESSYIYSQRGDIRYDLGDLDGAISDYTESLEIWNVDGPGVSVDGPGARWVGELYNSRAWTLYRKGDYAAALPDANVAVTKDPKPWEHWHTRGMIYAAQSEVVRAICDFQRALDLEPDDADETQKMRDYLARWVKAPENA